MTTYKAMNPLGQVVTFSREPNAHICRQCAYCWTLGDRERCQYEARGVCDVWKMAWGEIPLVEA